MQSSPNFQTKKSARIAALGLRESDFDENFTRASGPGGQHVNKVSTAVTVRHEPSGLAVTAQDSRSQSANRQLAWMRLLDLIERRRAEERAAQKAASEKERRRKRPRPWGVKQGILKAKKHRSKTKKMRGKGGEW